MSKRFLKRVFPLLAITLLVPWPVAYAYEYQIDVEAKDALSVEAAPAAESGWSAYGGAIGGLDAPVDLFYINGAEFPADIPVNLYITNTDELVHSYSYLNLKIGIYQMHGTEWQRAPGFDGDIITLRNGRVSFTLPGYARYKLTIDSGCFRCIAAGGGDPSPVFYLTVE